MKNYQPAILPARGITRYLGPEKAPGISTRSLLYYRNLPVVCCHLLDGVGDAGNCTL